MEIILTGTGSIWSTCNSASARINETIAVDFPNGAFRAQLRMGMDPGKIDHLILTHMHGDHMLDLPVWALGRVKFGFPAVNPKIYVPESFVGGLKQLMHAAFSESLGCDVIEEHFDFITADEFTIDGLAFQRIAVCHGNMEAYGYTVRDGKHTVSFSGDSGPCENIGEMAAASDVFICEAAVLKATAAHQGVESIIELAESNKNCAFYTTHMNDETRAALTGRVLPDNLHVGSDGLRISPDD